MIQTEHAIKIQTESFEGFESIFLNEEFALGWNCLFVLPVWLKSWWALSAANIALKLRYAKVSAAKTAGSGYSLTEHS